MPLWILPLLSSLYWCQESTGDWMPVFGKQIPSTRSLQIIKETCWTVKTRWCQTLGSRSSGMDLRTSPVSSLIFFKSYFFVVDIMWCEMISPLTTEKTVTQIYWITVWLNRYLFRTTQIQGWRTYGLQIERLAIWRGIYGPHAVKVHIQRPY